MKKFIVYSTIALSLVAPQAFAQAKNFEGFSIGGNLNFAKTTSDNSVLAPNGDSANDRNLSLWAQYQLALGNQFTLGLGGSADIIDLKAGSWGAGGDVKLKNTSSVYVAPGFALNDSFLLYGKVAYFTTTATASAVGDLAMSGYGFGIGLDSAITKSLFMKAEFMTNKADEKTSGTAKINGKNSVFSIGLGYKF